MVRESQTGRDRLPNFWMGKLKMLRWLIAILFLANVLAFVAVRGAFGPTPTAGGREPNHLNRQIRPEALKVQPVTAAEAADQAVVGAPAPSAPIAASALPQ